MIELGLDVQSYAKVMAEGLAFLHWVARIDANDVEFVLARSRSTSHSHPNSPFDITIFGTHLMWIIDFDCCNPVTMDENGAATAAECFWRNDPYYPRPGSTDTSDQELWCAFKNHYLEVSGEILKKEEQSVKNLPKLLIGIIEEGPKFTKENS